MWKVWKQHMCNQRQLQLNEYMQTAHHNRHIQANNTTHMCKRFNKCIYKQDNECVNNTKSGVKDAISARVAAGGRHLFGGEIQDLVKVSEPHQCLSGKTLVKNVFHEH